MIERGIDAVADQLIRWALVLPDEAALPVARFIAGVSNEVRRLLCLIGLRA